MDTIIQAFKTAYSQLVDYVLGGGLLQGVGIFVAFGLGYWILIGRGEAKLSLRNAWNYIFPRHIYAHPSARVDMWNWLLLTIFWGPASVTVAVILGIKLGFNFRDLLDAEFGSRGMLFHSAWATVTFQVGALYIGHHFAVYVVHYAYHRVPFLWTIHRAHHSTEALTFFANARVHPLENLSSRITDMLYIGFFGGISLYLSGTTVHPLTAPTLLTLETITGLGAAVAHSHIPLNFGWFNRFIGSSVLHQIHHSAETHHRDKNFGLNLMIFDWLFGTLYIPEPNEIYRWGLNEEEIGENNPHLRLRDLYIEPITRLWGGLVRVFVAPSKRRGASRSTETA